MRKTVLDKISTNAGAELNELSTPTITPAPEKALIARAQAGDTSVTMVSMNEGCLVSLKQDQPHTFFTYGLGGCQAVLVVSKDKNNGVTASLTHFDPTQLLENGQELSSLLKAHAAASYSHEALILVPGDWEKIGEKWQMAPSDKNLCDHIELVLKVGLGNDLSPQLLAYSKEVMVSFMQEECRAFILEWDGQTLRYSTVGHHQGPLLQET